MPTASLLLLPLRRLLSLIPSVLGLFPVLLRPPPMAARRSPLALPPFVPRLPTFALRPLAFLPTPSNHPRRPAAKRPASCPFSLWEQGWSLPRTRSPRVFRSRRHPAAPSHRAVPTAPQTPQKAPRAASRVFWKKLLLRARPPLPPTPATPITDPPSPPQQPPLPVIPASSAGTQHHGQSQRTHATPTSPASRAHLPLFSHSHSLLSPHSFLPAPQPSQTRPKNPPNLATAGREHP